MKSDTPVFKNAQELAGTLDAVKKVRPSNAKDVTKGKTSRTLFDVFDELRQAKNKNESERLVKKNKVLSDIVAGKGDQYQLINLKFNPSLAHVTDDEGHLVVGDREFDVLKEDDTRELMRMMPEPLPEPEPGGGGSGGGPSYTFTENPPQELAQWLPCGPWTVLPGYPTHFFDANIGGRTVLVQLWKGSCPDYLLQLAGGVGAEVGLYNRDMGLPHWFWWPDHQHQKMIEFTLFNPVTTAPFFTDTNPGPIWWSHKWMTFPSYDQYKRDQQNQVPGRTEDYVLRSRIDGQSFEW